MRKRLLLCLELSLGLVFLSWNVSLAQTRVNRDGMQQNMTPGAGMNGNGDQMPGKGNMGMTMGCSPGMMPDSGMRGDGDDIKCRINNVLSKNQALMDTLTSQLGNCSSTDRHCKGMQNSLKHAQNSQAKAV